MSAAPRAELAPGLAEELAIAALGWLAAGCAAGLLLALLLAWPDLNALLAPLTYGRWVPVHLDALLYGWTALPLVGLLLRLYLPGAEGEGAGRAAHAIHCPPPRLPPQRPIPRYPPLEPPPVWARAPGQKATLRLAARQWRLVRERLA